MNIALEQATNLRRGTNRTAVLPTAQPHAPARPALPSPPLTRHSETHRASGETPARFTPLPGARPNRAEATAYCDARCADTNKLCGLLSWTSLAGVRSWLAISSGSSHRDTPAVAAKPLADVFAFLELLQLVVAGDLTLGSTLAIAAHTRPIR